MDAQAVPPHRKGRVPDHPADDRRLAGDAVQRSRRSLPRSIRWSRPAASPTWSAALPLALAAEGGAGPHPGARLSSGAGGDGRRREAHAFRRRCSAGRRDCCAAGRPGSTCWCSTRRICSCAAGQSVSRSRRRGTGPTMRCASPRWRGRRRRSASGLLAGFVPDVLHAHDWQAGLRPAYLHIAEGRARAPVMTVHNLAFQGHFPAGAARAARPAAGLFASTASSITASSVA